MNDMDRSELLSIATPDFPVVTRVTFSPNGRLLGFVAFSFDHPGSAVEVWDVNEGRRLQALAGPDVASRLAFSPDGRLLAVSGDHRDIKVWEAASGREVAAWKGWGSATFSPDGKFLVSGNEKAISYWDVSTGRREDRFRSTGGRVTFSPDGRTLAVSGPTAVELRDAATGGEIRRLPHGPLEEGAGACDTFRRRVPTWPSAPMAGGSSWPRLHPGSGTWKRARWSARSGPRRVRCTAWPSARTVAWWPRPARTHPSASGMSRTGLSRAFSGVTRSGWAAWPFIRRAGV